MKAQAALRAAAETLRACGLDDPMGDARALLSHVMGLAPGRLTLHLSDDLTEAQRTAFDTAIAARGRHQPVAQLTGQRLFWGRAFRVTPDVLDPRPETEILVAEAIRRPFFKVLDLGTGSGCILVSVLKSMPMAVGTGVDLSDAALAVAALNIADHGLRGRAHLVRSNWFAQVPGRFDLIVSNPPYIAADEMAALSPDVRNWEPHLALTPGGDGLDAYRAIAFGAPARLMAGGRILLEIGPTQGSAVLQLLQAQGFEDLRILPDLDGRDRVVSAVRPGAGTETCGAI